MYEAIEALIEAIKQESWYLEFIDAREACLNNEELTVELKTMERLLEEKQDLTKYSAYIPLDDINEKIKAQNQVLSRFEDMRNYQNCLHVLNMHLDEISQVVFGGISKNLTIGRIGKLYARYSR